MSNDKDNTVAEKATTGTVEPRVEAPDVEVDIMHVDERKALQDEADEKFPDRKHTYKGMNASDDDLYRHELEPVHWEDIRPDCPAKMKGKSVRFRGDVLHRLPRELHEKQKRRGEALSSQLVERSMKQGGNKDGKKWKMNRRVRNPRDPAELLDED
jgi:hypothetical protein